VVKERWTMCKNNHNTKLSLFGKHMGFSLFGKRCVTCIFYPRKCFKGRSFIINKHKGSFSEKWAACRWINLAGYNKRSGIKSKVGIGAGGKVARVYNPAMG
jgi:hypothetical protein